MTSSTSSHIHSYHGRISTFAGDDPRLSNWPVVYVLNNHREAYVGESLNVLGRFAQHEKSLDKRGLDTAHVLIDSQFNKSAALDLESHLVRLLAGDGQFEVLNRNDGIVDAEYFDRDKYRQRFDEIFREFQALGVLSQPVQQIENSDLFKLSPFKALNPDQEQTIHSFLGDLIRALAGKTAIQAVIQGDPGTGKTIVGVYLMKLLRDLGSERAFEDPEEESVFADPEVRASHALFVDLKLGIVVPQQSLRESIKQVFAKTPGLDKAMVMTPFDVGESEQRFDLLIVDETHRLNRRANQPSAINNTRFSDINKRLFNEDDSRFTQLDWIEKMSTHQVFLLDAAQSVRPADLPQDVLEGLIGKANGGKRFYPLSSQMRVKGGDDYITYVRALFSDTPPEPRTFSSYDFRWFDDLSQMETALREKERHVGLARMIAGYAWRWVSQKNKHAYDIEVEGFRRRWNTTATDWIQSPGAIDEVGSIHTVQGYDLNYAGVIIGNDLGYDPDRKRFFVNKDNYFDTKGKENSPKFGVAVTDDDLLRYVINIYVVLLTRGIRGTFVYVCDPELRRYLQPFVDR